MTCGIYKIEAKCPVAKKMGIAIYIGQSKNIERRWKRHIKKYPEDQYNYEILLNCDVQYLDFFEKAFISGYDSHKRGLNKTIGGTSIKTQFPHKETCHKISESIKGDKNPMRRKNSEDSKKKISNALKGVKKSEDVKQKISNTLKGVKKSEETRRKMCKPKTKRQK